MTVNQNALLYGGISLQGVKQLAYPCNNATFPIHQGDLVYFDTTAHIVKALDSDAHAATLAGVAAQPTAVSSNLDNSTVATPTNIIVSCEGVFTMKTTAAETYAYGTVVYAGADAQTVTTVAGSNALGKVILVPGGSAITGASGVTVQVYIPAKYL